VLEIAEVDGCLEFVCDVVHRRLAERAILCREAAGAAVPFQQRQ
jgi:hypothetical protein